MRARVMCLIGLLLLATLQLLSLYTLQIHAQAVFDPATDIFFEYGAESGQLKPPWEVATPMGRGDRSGSYVRVDAKHARTGTKSMKFYQVPPVKSDAQRRVEARWYDSPKDVYISFWVYVDDHWLTKDTYGWGSLFGGAQGYFGPPSNPWKYMTSARWLIHPITREILVSYQCYDIQGTFNVHWRAQDDTFNTHIKLTDYLNQWIHLQTHFKCAKDYTGIVEHWFNDSLVKRWTGVKTDPEGYPEWNSQNLAWARGTQGGPWVVSELYQDKDSFESWVWMDDIVGSTTYVPASYRVGGQSVEFENWEEGFESGDFSSWNGTKVSDPSEAWATVTSTYACQGSFSANFTTDGSLNSYARAKHIVQNTPEVYMRSFVRFEDLPDTNNSVIWFYRIAREDGTWIASAGVHRINSNYYWIISTSGGGNTQNETQTTINADTWYEVEFYFNATSNGNGTLWVYTDVETKMCEVAGDFSGVGDIASVYSYIYLGGWGGDQAAGKSLYHDDFRVDDVRIGRGTIMTFQTISYFLTGLEDQPVVFSPLEDVKINGTRLTDTSGCCEWVNSAYNKVHTFVIEKPAGYYPAWVLNVEGSFSWNGTHYILSHNFTETQTDPIEIYFSSTEEVYIKSSTHKLTSVYYNSSSQNPHKLMRFNITADIGVTSRLEIYTADEGHPRPYKIEGASDWSYDSLYEILTVWMLHTGDEDAEIEWRGAAMGQ